MRTLKLHISYDGEVFYGMQRQTQFEPTVQSMLEKSFSEFYQKDVKVSYAGRTDRGVHAEGQIISFVDQGKIPLIKLKDVLNSCINSNSIVINSVEEVAKSFDPRRHASWREYEYWFYTGEKKVFLNKHMLHVRNMDIERVNDYCECLIGEKDFALFCKSSDKYENTIREIMMAAVHLSEYSLLGIKGDSYLFRVRANGFLHNMVRRIVGLLLAALEDNLTKQEFSDIVTANKRYLWQMAPAQGLFLTHVEYIRDTKGTEDEK